MKLEFETLVFEVNVLFDLLDIDKERQEGKVFEEIEDKVLENVIVSKGKELFVFIIQEKLEFEFVDEEKFFCVEDVIEKRELEIVIFKEIVFCDIIIEEE